MLRKRKKARTGRSWTMKRASVYADPLSPPPPYTIRSRSHLSQKSVGVGSAALTLENSSPLKLLVSLPFRLLPVLKVCGASRDGILYSKQEMFPPLRPQGGASTLVIFSVVSTGAARRTDANLMRSTASSRLIRTQTPRISSPKALDWVLCTAVVWLKGLAALINCPYWLIWRSINASGHAIEADKDRSRG